MSGDHDRCFLTLVLEAFRQVFFNTNVLPCITIGADVWGESDIMTIRKKQAKTSYLRV